MHKGKENGLRIFQLQKDIAYVLGHLIYGPNSIAPNATLIPGDLPYYLESFFGIAAQ